MQFGKELQLLILVHCAKAVLGSYDYLGTSTITTISTKAGSLYELKYITMNLTARTLSIRSHTCDQPQTFARERPAVLDVQGRITIHAECKP